MADKNVDFQGTDLFGLNTQFHPESSSSSVVADYAVALSATGDVECESADLNERTEYTNTFTYCNATPNIATDLDTHITTFGGVSEEKAVTEMTVAFSAGEYAKVTITGHQHSDNPHTELPTASMAGIIPVSAGFGCPDIFANSNADATPVSVEVRFSCNHVDREGADGNHWAGTTMTFRADVTAEYIGVPTLTTTGWKVDSAESTDANQDADGYRITAHKYLDAVAP